MQSSDKTRELKWRVDEKALPALRHLASGPAGATLHQVNHVLDTQEHALQDAKYALRLRQENGRAVLTVKGPPTGKATLLEHADKDLLISAVTAEQVLSGETSPVEILERDPANTEGHRRLLGELKALLRGRPVRLVGTFRNERAPLPLTLTVGGRSLALTLELDRTVFPGEVVHHELEVELPDDADAPAVEEALRARLGGIEIGPSTPKIKRFYEIVGF